MNVEVNVKIKIRGYSEDYKLFLEQLSTLDIKVNIIYSLKSLIFA